MYYLGVSITRFVDGDLTKNHKQIKPNLICTEEGSLRESSLVIIQMVIDANLYISSLVFMSMTNSEMDSIDWMMMVLRIWYFECGNNKVISTLID